MGWLTARLSGIPAWITSRRDLGFKRKKIYNKVFRFSSKDCKKCIANCYAVKDKMTQQGSLPDGKIEVIYNGLDLSIYQKSHNDKVLRKELGVEDDVPLVGMIANFNFEIKGHRCFLEAAKGVMEKVRDVEFLLVGDGPLRNQYKEMAQNIGIKEKVHFLGERPDVPAILSHLAVSVLSSTSEGFSNVILESMAAGRPVIATKIGGSPEIVVDGVTGYLVPPGDSLAMAEAITELLQDPDKARAMGSAGRKVVKEKFTVETMVKKYEELYASLLEHRGRNPINSNNYGY
jgi:glycosyltransferase involved in cell wall biosynthesis